MSLFRNAFEKKLIRSLSNNFGEDNYDHYRFGVYKKAKRVPVYKNLTKKNRIKQFVKRGSKYFYNKIFRRKIALKKGGALLKGYVLNIEKYWLLLNEKDQELLIELLVYKVLGYKKVKLPLSNNSYWDNVNKMKELADDNDVYDPKFMHFKLKKFNLKSIGYDVKLYFSEPRVYVDFVLEQYAYKIGNRSSVSAESGDVVLDIGACWGDTALYFASKVKEEGKVYSFEFIPNNIKLFDINMNFNQKLRKRIKLIECPVSNSSGNKIYFKDDGPGSSVKFDFFEGHTGTAKTISIDDFVEKEELNKVDFIKMDIEGAEPMALEGAIKTIKKFKPKLAIAIYHNMNDFSNIPNWIHDLNIGYEVFIDHFTIHSEETICFAKVK